MVRGWGVDNNYCLLVGNRNWEAIMSYEITTTYWPERMITVPVWYSIDPYPRGLQNMRMEPPRLEVTMIVTNSHQTETFWWKTIFDYNGEKIKVVLVELRMHLEHSPQNFYERLQCETESFKFMEVIQFRLDHVERVLRPAKRGL